MIVGTDDTPCSTSCIVPVWARTCKTDDDDVAKTAKDKSRKRTIVLGLDYLDRWYILAVLIQLLGRSDMHVREANLVVLVRVEVNMKVYP